jgi:ABC-2 type transport system permease protein
MKARVLSLSILYLKSTFGFSFPTKAELKNPKKLAKIIGIALLVLLLLADFSVIFVMMNISLYDGLAGAGMQGLMLLNAATLATIMVFIFAFTMALSMFSVSGIEAGFLVLPISSRELLAAKMALIYSSSAVLGVFIFIVTMIIYGIREAPPIMFYFNGIVTALVLPLVPTALSYLLLIPFTKASKLLHNKNFILYVGGFLGMVAALGFNLYLQSAMVKMANPEEFAAFASADSLISRMGKAWIPSWLAWKALSDAGSLRGLLATMGNLGLGLVFCLAVSFVLGNSYVRSLQDYGESTSTRKQLSKLQAGIFVRRSSLRALVYRELRLMNREPMYMLNGPFIVILMPIIMAIVFFAQKDMLNEMMSGIEPLLKGPGSYLIPAAFGAFLGSATSIACTAVSRDAKTISWIRSLPINPMAYFYAKLIHAQIFSAFGAVVGSALGILLFGTSLVDTLIAGLLALLFSTALNMGGIWIDTASPRLSWDNPIAAMKQNPNSVIVILAAMACIGGLGFLSMRLAVPKYAFAFAYGGLFLLPILAWFRAFPKFAHRRFDAFEV